MGIVAGWIAVKTQDESSVLSELGLVKTGELDLDGGARASLAALPGWTVVSMQDLDFATPDKVRQLSAGGEAMGFQMSEIVMWSAGCAYRAGERLWFVAHDPEAGRENLEAQGSLPPEFDAIRDSVLQDQAAHVDEGVDYVFDAPIALSAALCGYRPDEGGAPDVVFHVVEPIRSGKAGERQAASRSLRERLHARVRGELFPAAERLGFEPILRHPAFHRYYPRCVPNVFVRYRGGEADCLEFRWGLPEGAPRVSINFFVRKGSEPRYGRAGSAYVPPPPLTFVERFTGRKQEPDAAIEQAIADGRDMLDVVDRHLREGVSHPNLRPAEYLDERASG